MGYMGYSWQKVTDISAANHRCLERDDFCIYYRTKERHVYNNFTETNSILANFKKRPSHCRGNTQMAMYKERGIETVTRDVAGFFESNPGMSFLLIPAITSKACDDPEFDNRLIRVCSNVAKALPNVCCADLLYVGSSILSAHSGGARDVSYIASQIGVRGGFDMRGFDRVFIFDDVLTTGAHFKACQWALAKAYGIRAYGIFWAREESLV